MTTATQDLTREDYEMFRQLVYRESGINLGEHKMQLVRARLGKRIRQGDFGSFRDYYHHVENDATGEALTELLDAITTNTTHLFRELRHFTLLGQFIRNWVNDPAWRRRHSTLRIWSAACSSGEEPHSIAMVAHDALSEYPQVQLKVLATDLSTQMLQKARQGLYDVHRTGTVPPEFKKKHLQPVSANGQAYLRVAPEISRNITFARFNLMTPAFAFKHGFDIIFCRNVMIYFDRPTQEQLIHKISQQLHPDGYLMIGHSESLNAIKHPLAYVEPTVYQKK